MTPKSIIRRLLPVCALLGISVGQAAPSSYVWVEEPSQTNFPETIQWTILREGKAPAVTRKTAKEDFQASYLIDVPAPGGTFQLWGRSYDPGWSSPMQWRVDQGKWQTWEPGPAADRAVENGTFVMSWHRWGTVKLAPGQHTVEIELTGKRKTGDTAYFVLDSLLLVKGDFAPQGAKTPDDLLADQAAIIKEKLQGLDTGSQDFLEQASEIYREATTVDLLAGLNDFRRLQGDIDRALEAKALLVQNRSVRLSGRVEEVTVDGCQLTLKTQWSNDFAGRVWIGILQNEALYAVIPAEVSYGKQHTFNVTLPDGLPSGTLMAMCVPIDQRVSVGARTYFTSPAQAGESVKKPASWGIYRDNELRVHPWNVTEGGMMMWDGEPFIPVGGMVNTRLSWGTKAGDTNIARSDILEAQFQLLKSYGLTDIYFNGLFIHANPASMAMAVGLAEKYGMHYGLHVTSTPDAEARSPGFVQSDKFDRYDPIEVSRGTKQAPIEYRVSSEEYVPQGRCMWIVFSKDDKLLASGIVTPELRIEEGLEVPAGVKNKHMQRLWPTLTHVLRAEAKFGLALPEDGKLVIVPEIVMPRNDPSGYLDGIGTYHQKLRDVYGSLELGAGLRMWVDPFLNEIHNQNTYVSTSPTYVSRYAGYLLQQYGTIQALNQAWSPQGKSVPDFATASRLIPLKLQANSVLWMDPQNATIYRLGTRPANSLFDLANYKNQIAEEMLTETVEVLKSIADVPVVLKHNTWSNPWFVNSSKTEGLDGMGFESYCYGDSLVYHNSLVPLAQALASARNIWTLETETSPAAFDGQKDYVGYMDRLQMLNDFDLMAMVGAKGIYTFGFIFDPNGRYQITELIRDPRQLEWMATYMKTLHAAAPRLANYIPELYGWYPVSIHEKQFTGDPLARYEMDGHYIGTSGQIRMAPDGRWIIPAFNTNMGLEGYLTAWDFLSSAQQKSLLANKPEVPVWFLRDTEETTMPKTWSSYPLDSFTASGIGVIPPTPKAKTLDDFRREILGYRVFQTDGINGCTLTDGSLMIWTCVERDVATVTLPGKARVTDILGLELKPDAGANGNVELTLEQSPHERLTTDLPLYLQHRPNSYYYEASEQYEVAIIKGVSVDELLALNPPAWHRWLPEAVMPEDVAAWIEAEDSNATTFVQPRVEGYSRYSGGAAIGMNTHWRAPEGEEYTALYEVKAEDGFSKLYLRRMSKPVMDLRILVDGEDVGTIPAVSEMTDVMHLNPWNAGLSVNNINVGWIELELPREYEAGKHRIEMIALPSVEADREVDLALLGGQSDKAVEDEAKKEGSELMGLQVDALMLVN